MRKKLFIYLLIYFANYWIVRPGLDHSDKKNKPSSFSATSLFLNYIKARMMPWCLDLFQRLYQVFGISDNLISIPWVLAPFSFCCICEIWRWCGFTLTGIFHHAALSPLLKKKRRREDDEKRVINKDRKIMHQLPSQAKTDLE